MLPGKQAFFPSLRVRFSSLNTVLGRAPSTLISTILFSPWLTTFSFQSLSNSYYRLWYKGWPTFFSLFLSGLAAYLKGAICVSCFLPRTLFCSALPCSAQLSPDSPPIILLDDKVQQPRFPPRSQESRPFESKYQRGSFPLARALPRHVYPAVLNPHARSPVHKHRARV